MLYYQEGKNSFPVLLIYVELSRSYTLYTFQVCINLFQFIQCILKEVMVLSFRLDLVYHLPLILLSQIFSMKARFCTHQIFDQNLTKISVSGSQAKLSKKKLKLIFIYFFYKFTLILLILH